MVAAQLSSRRGSLARWLSVDILLVFGVALLVRIVVTAASPGGFTGDLGYDAGVYYAAADAFTFGRMPYADFVLLHPPGIMLFLSPFAWLGRLTTDHTGLIVASQFFAGLGAANAALITGIARRVGLSRPAALVGGLFYASWSGCIATEVATRLEPLGTFCFLCGVLLLTGTQISVRTRMAAGALLAAAVTVKIWWIVPLLIVIGWQLVPARSRRGVIPLAGGAVGALIVVLGPFFLRAPVAMWHMVVTDETTRQESSSPFLRLGALTALRPGIRPFGSLVLYAAVALLIALMAVAVVVAWRRGGWARMFTVIVIAQLAVLIIAPVYHTYYTGYPASLFALVLACAADGLPDRARLTSVSRLVASGVVLVSAASTALAIATGHLSASTRFPASQVAQAVAPYKCVMSDSAMVQITTNSLSRGLGAGCPNWIDVSGRTYDVDRAPGPAYVPRYRNVKWQASALRYLSSGDVLVLFRGATGLSAATLATLTSNPTVVRTPTSPSIRVFRTAR